MRKMSNGPEWPLFTIGYEKYSLEEFADYLKIYNIRNIVDVRQYPKSRKRGFSKGQLQKFFSSVGIKYYHLGLLGSPSEIRKKVLAEKDYKQFFRDYQAHLVEQEDSLTELAEIIKQDTTCIFCLEADYNFCHRKTVAAYLNIVFPESFGIIHL